MNYDVKTFKLDLMLRERTNFLVKLRAVILNSTYKYTF